MKPLLPKPVPKSSPPSSGSIGGLKPSIVHLFSTFELDLLRAFQYLYYVRKKSLLPDDVYDALEKEYSGKTPVGSDKADDYSPAVRALALYIEMSYYESQQKHSLL